jgi:hypothetical protein
METNNIAGNGRHGFITFRIRNLRNHERKYMSNKHLYG